MNEQPKPTIEDVIQENNTLRQQRNFLSASCLDWELRLFALQEQLKIAQQKLKELDAPNAS